MQARKERILILAKTYPSPSAQYVETSCVAGITDSGMMRRLYPVPFRMIEDSSQFKKWQWISVQVQKATKDHRPESHKLYVDTIDCQEVIDTKNGWTSRRNWLEKVPVFTDFDQIQASRIEDGLSIALLRPKFIVSLDISKARHPDWTDDEREKLVQEQMNLFSALEARHQVRELRKIPFDFYYRYVCATPDGEKEFRHKIVDWEAGALFWKCKANYGTSWEIPFREKLEIDLPSKDLMFLLGNQHRFQEQWLIISLVYPPKQKPQEMRQASLF